MYTVSLLQQGMQAILVNHTEILISEQGVSSQGLERKGPQENLQGPKG